MKKIAFLSLAFFFSFLVTAQENDENLSAQIDSIESSFTYQTGTVELKNGIAKAQHHEVLHRLFAEVMVDAVDLLLVKVTRYVGVDFAGCGKVCAQWFFEYDA